MKNKLSVSIFVLSSIIMFSGTVSAASVGAVPGAIDFGEVERGETVTRDVYVRAFDIRENFTVQPTVSSDSEGDLFDDSFPGRFDVTEQSFNDWVELNEATINPNNRQTITLANGNSAVVNDDFRFRMEVPDDAEPGIRRGIVRLNPNLTNEGSGAGARVIGETKLNFQFEVPGNAERQISVQDVRAFRQGQNEAAIEVLLRNSGTVTASTDNFEVDIFDSRRNREETITVSSIELEPGESEWVDGYWSQDTQIEEGTYQIDGSVNYMTGSATASGSFSLPGLDRIEVRPEEDEGGQDSSGGSDGVPVWFVVIVLVILGVLMWGFEIEPFWILVILGVLGISAFILMSGVPNYLLAILIIIVGIIIYGGM